MNLVFNFEDQTGKTFGKEFSNKGRILSGGEFSIGEKNLIRKNNSPKDADYRKIRSCGR